MNIDEFIVQDCKFTRITAQRSSHTSWRIKTQDILVLYQCALAIPPSKHLNIQMATTDIRKTSRTTNIRIYVEQAI